MSPEIQTTFAVMGAKFAEFDHEYCNEGGGSTALENMAAIARVALILLPAGLSAAQLAFDTFVRRVSDLEYAERNGAQSTQFDRVEATMDKARHQAVAAFLALMEG